MEKKEKSLFTPGTLLESALYDPKRDIAPVEQVGFVDLHDAFVNASIPGELNVSEENYNGVDEPESLLGRSADVFEAYRKADYVQKTSAAVAAAKAEADAASSTITE